MGKYEVHYSCGHVGEVKLFGPMKDRENHIKGMEKYGLCDACYEKKVIAELKEWEEKEETIADLVGSEKQVSWARKIRRKIITDFDKTFNSSSDPTVPVFRKWMMNQTEAKLWIDVETDPDPDVLGPRWKVLYKKWKIEAN